MPLDLTEFAETSRSQRGAVVVYRYRKAFNTLLVEEAFGIVEESATHLLTQLYEIHSSMKVEIILGLLMERKQIDEQGNEYFQQQVMYFVSKHEMNTVYDIDFMLLSSASEIYTKLEEFLENSSQWYVKNIDTFDIKIGELRLFQNARPTGYLEMPLRGRRGFVNIRTKEPICFQLSVCASLNWNIQQLKNERNGVTRGNLKRVCTWKKYMSNYDWSDVVPQFDIYNDLVKFEHKNRISVNIFTEHKGDVVLMRKSEYKSPKTANLFLIVKRRKDLRYDTHFAAITDVHMFLGKPWPRRMWFCQRCFRHFNKVGKMYAHFAQCVGPQEYKPEEVIPGEDECIEFKKYEMTLQYPYTLFFDFETYSVPVPESERQKGESTMLEYRYEPASYALCVAAQEGESFNINEVEYYDGPNCASHFLKRAFELSEKYLEIIRTTNNFILPTEQELLEFEASTECHLCHREFTNVTKMGEQGNPTDAVESEDDDDPMDNSGDDLSDYEEEEEQIPMRRYPEPKPVLRCYHHRHIDGKYLFALCRECNLRIRYKHEIPIIAHGGSNFDFHILLANLNPSIIDFKDIKVLAKSSEKIIEITMMKKNETLSPLKGNYGDESMIECGSRKVKLRFLDNYNYLSSSLSALSSALSKDGCRYWHMLAQSMPTMLSHMKEWDLTHQNLLLKKLPFCYQYLSSPEVLKDGHPLPPREKWNNELKNHKITDEEWSLVQEVCETLKIPDLRTFTRIYTLLDTILLCIINTNFRSICMELYQMDPLYNCTLSGFSWNCFLHMTESRIQYVRDKNMLQLVNDSIRGGLCFNSKTRAEANNPLLLDYNPEKEDSYIAYYDVNRYVHLLL